MVSYIRSRRLLAILGVILLAAFTTLLILLLTRPNNGARTPGDTGAVQIQVKESGLYRITTRQLRAVGHDIDFSNSTLPKLTSAGEQVPYYLAEEALIFYGVAPDSRYSSFRPYILSFIEPGHPMDEERTAEPNGEVIDVISRTLRLEENQIYDGRAMGTELPYLGYVDPWFWAIIQNDGQLSLDFELENIEDESSALIRAALYGATSIVSIDPDHDVTVILNDAIIGTLTWDGEEHHLGELTVTPGILRTGRNTLTFDNTTGQYQDADSDGSSISPIDIVRLDWIEVEYFSAPIAEDDAISINGRDGAITVSGFSVQPELFDISNNSSPLHLSGANSNGKSLSMQMQDGRSYIAASDDGFISDAVLQPVLSSNLENPSIQADLVILTTSELSPTLASLVEWRESQGLAVKVAAVEEVYDQFGHGDRSPESITKFIRYALSEWQEPYPAYLLIVGDASYDYRDYLQLAAENLIPSPMVSVAYGGETVSDARLGDIDLDGRPDLAIGRWPVRTEDEVASLVRRTIEYEQGTAAEVVLLAADGTSQEFSSLNDEVFKASDLPEDSAVRLYGVPSSQLLDAWSSGAWLVSYAGHGSIDRWGKDDVFSAEAVPDLKTDGSPPIVLQMTCLTGFYAHPTTDSISELMLRDENGPVEIIAATSLTLSSSQKPFGINLLKELQNPESIRVGDALQKAKLQLDVENSKAMREISETFILLGDPSAIIVRPE